MARGTAGKRDRVLSDEELRAFWRASVGWQHPFSLMLRYVLLTAARRDEAAEMQWSELTRLEAPEGHLWMIPAGRYKTKVDFDLPLSEAARTVLIATPLLSELRKAATERGEDPEKVTPKQGFVFTTGGRTGLAGFSKFKRRFDARMLAELRHTAARRAESLDDVTLERWTTHDLRRTARSLMTRAGIEPDHAERVLGHVIPGVRQVYDRHSYLGEKYRAVEALAAQVERILNPTDNVVPLRGKTAG
jgi:integrase